MKELNPTEIQHVSGANLGEGIAENIQQAILIGGLAVTTLAFCAGFATHYFYRYFKP